MSRSISASTPFAISGITINQDAQGRYCLNDLHKAAGGESRHQPAKWLITQQATELVELLKSELSITGIPVIQTKQGLGTFVVKELVYAFAMWISAKFHITVIRAYDSLVSPKRHGLVELESMNKTQAGIINAIVTDISESNSDGGVTKHSLWSRFNKHFEIAGYKDLPSVKFDDAVVKLNKMRSEYDEGFAMVQAKRDDLIALGYDKEAMVFKAKALPAPEITRPIIRSMDGDELVVVPASIWTEMKAQTSIIESLTEELNGFKSVLLSHFSAARDAERDFILEHFAA